MAQPACNANASPATSPSCSRSSTRRSNHYVDERGAEVIQDWRTRVPDKLPKERCSMTDSDPSVQAYIAAKLALLHIDDTFDSASTVLQVNPVDTCTDSQPASQVPCFGHRHHKHTSRTEAWDSPCTRRASRMRRVQRLANVIPTTSRQWVQHLQS